MVSSLQLPSFAAKSSREKSIPGGIYLATIPHRLTCIPYRQCFEGCGGAKIWMTSSLPVPLVWFSLFCMSKNKQTKKFISYLCYMSFLFQFEQNCTNNDCHCIVSHFIMCPSRANCYDYNITVSC